MAVTFPPSGKDARQRRRAATGFIAGFALLLLLSAAGWWSSLMAIPSFAWVTETQQGISKAEGLLRLIAEAESAERAYLITSEPRHLQIHRGAVAQIEGVLDDLAAQVAAKPVQRALVEELRALVQEKLADVANAITARDAGGFDAGRAIVAADAGAGAMARIRERTAELVSSEVVVRSRQEAAFLRRSRRATIAIGLALVVTTLLMAYAVRWLHRRMRDLENIVTICAWTKRVKHRGQWVTIEEYLRQRYGLLFSHGISEQARRQLELEGLEHRGSRGAPADPGAGV